MTRRNVLFITLDQWRRDCLGIAGRADTAGITPNLDRLAASGAWFKNHWATSVPCGPSRASLLTGLYAMNHRAVINGTPLKPGITNLTLEARGAGYDPVLFGYTDTSPDPAAFAADDPRLRRYEGVLPGFRAVLDMPFESMDPWLEWLAELGYDLDDPQSIYRGVEPGQPARFRAEHSEAAFLTNRLLDWLEHDRVREIDPDGPGWFVHATFIRPHPPYQVPAPYHAQFDPASVVLPFRLSDREAEGEQHLVARMATGLPSVASPDDDDLHVLIATYFGMVAEVDAQVGRLLTWLDESGEGDDTLVVVTADHGEQLGEHWLIEKLGYWDASYAVPLIVRAPDAQPGIGPVERITEHVDVAPTILEWLGVPVPPSMDGRSLLSFISEPDGVERPETRLGDWRSTAHWEWDFRDPVDHAGEDLLGVPMQHCGMTVLRGERYKYVHFAADALPDLLFDLVEDPHQVHDLAADPAFASVRADCASDLLSWRMRHAERALTDTVITPGGPRTRHDPRSGS